MKKLKKLLSLILLLLWYLTVCSSQNGAIQHLNLKFNRLNRITNGLQRDVDDIWTALSNIVVGNSGQVNQDNNETEPENPNSEELLKLVNGTVSEVKELKAEVEELMVYAQNGLKHEKAFSRKILKEIQTSQIDHEAITSNDIAEMKIWLQNLEQKQRQTLEDKFQNFTSKTENDDRILLEKTRNTTNNCEAKLEENKSKLEEHELEIQALNDKLETVKENFTSMEKYVTEKYLTDAMALVKQEIFEKLQEANIICKDPWIIFGDSCYLMSSEAMTWNDAQRFCNTKEGHLIEIDNIIERDFLVQTCKVRLDGIWVGGTDQETEGTFVWKTNKKTVQSDYFAPGEPNNSGGHEDCTQLYCHGERVGKLNDGTCEVKLNFVCEKSKYRF